MGGTTADLSSPTPSCAPSAPGGSQGKQFSAMLSLSQLRHPEVVRSWVERALWPPAACTGPEAESWALGGAWPSLYFAQFPRMVFSNPYFLN